MRLIDADKLNEELEDWYKHCGGTTNQRDWIIQSSAMDTVNEAETVDAEPVRHGEWIKAHGMLPPEFFGKHKCSLCGHFALSWRIGHEELSNYCPNCGAKMDGGKQDANV